MRKNKKSLILILVVLISVLIGKTSEASELKFSVEPVLPENQFDKENTYFDLKVSPNQKQTLKIHMRNETNQEVIVEPVIKPATTNLNGVVEYGVSNNKLDQTAPYDISTLLKIKEKEVAIPAKKAIDLELELHMPKESFDGILAGGITLQEKEKEKTKKKETKKQGLAIENRYAYVVAVVLRENEKELKPALELDKVEASQVNARNVINATLKNPEARYLNRLSVESTITKKGSKEKLYTSKKENMQMAPNSSFAYPVSLNGERLESGNYTLNMMAKSGDKSWKFTKDFEIGSKEAKELNKKDVTIEEEPSLWLYLIVSVLEALVIGLLFTVFLMKKKKKKRKSKKKKSKKKTKKK
ncbi:MAG: DUF916 and DUF3324 domain-containing protein [Vagococcus sp.]|uniref:DUF916 and DUF3324 domain-containing protein n=1 Tax=Vagococcus sp. TaxID=1933889 RepID=UPI002FC6CA59